MPCVVKCTIPANYGSKKHDTSLNSTNYGWKGKQYKNVFLDLYVQQILFIYFISVELLIFLSRFEEKIPRKHNYSVVNHFYIYEEHPHVSVCRPQRICHKLLFYNSNSRTFQLSWS
jgi:hypothetical protein